MVIKNGRYVGTSKEVARRWLIGKTSIFGFSPNQVISFIMASAVISIDEATWVKWLNYQYNSLYNYFILQNFIIFLLGLYLLYIILCREREFKKICGHYCIMPPKEYVD